MSTIRVSYGEWLTTREFRAIDVDPDKWEAALGKPFDVGDVDADDFEEYASCQGIEIESIEYEVRRRQLVDIEAEVIA